MEGRAIARPNHRQPRHHRTRLVYLQWRAGLLPGRTVRTRSSVPSNVCLQWRAGLLPGRTCPSAVLAGPSLSFNGGPGYCPAEPGRTTRTPGRSNPFNGGPGYCPAEPDSDLRPSRTHIPSMEGRAIARPNVNVQGAVTVLRGILQWRAGLLPGRTAPPVPPAVPASPLQWRAGLLPGRTIRT